MNNPPPTLASLISHYNLGPDTPGFICRIQRRDDILLDHCVGQSNGVALTTDSNFRLASLTKQFTSVAVLQLVEKNMLALETSLTDIFPQFPDYGRAITIRHLLSHTSGLPDYEDRMREMPSLHGLDTNVFDLALSEKATLFHPGSQYRYSNGAYCLLALIVAKLTVLPFGDYLKRHIFAPAGMVHSRLNDEADIPNRVYGYRRDGDTWQLKDQDKTSGTQGDGGIYSSAEDLIRWHKALYGNRLISARSLELMTECIIARGDRENEYAGFGIFIRKIGDLTCYRHGGASIGFSNSLMYFPQQDLSIILLSNIDDMDTDTVMNALALDYTSR